MISILLITLPTLLMGCLPTYAHVGLAAPVLMAVLRFVQGVAVGGEVRWDCTGHASCIRVCPASCACICCEASKACHEASSGPDI
jgi:MFS family permease